EKDPAQKSKPIKLEAGKKYYVEAVYKEGSRGDHCSVGWQIPGGEIERPIAGSRLSPAAKAKTVAIKIPENRVDFGAALPDKPGFHKLKCNIKRGQAITELPFVLYLPNGYTPTGENL